MIDHDPQVLRRIVALRQLPMFAAAELGDLVLLADNLVEAAYPAGAVVVAAGQQPHALHVVVDGEITTADHSWGSHQVFAALEVLANQPLAREAVATRDTHTLQLFSTDVVEVLDESFGVLRATLRELAGRVALSRTPERLVVPATEPLGFVDRLIVLRQHPAFAGARLDALAMLAHAADEVQLPRGAVLAREGDPVVATHIVLDGTLTGGLESGDAIGALETLAEMRHRTTHEATTPVRVLEIAAAAMFDVLEDHTDLGLTMIARLATELSEAANGARNRPLAVA